MGRCCRAEDICGLTEFIENVAGGGGGGGDTIASLRTLSGTSSLSTHLGTFTGTTIADNLTVKAAVQSLETAVESKAASSHNHSATDINSGTLATARLGSGTANNTTYLRGDQTWQTISGGTPGGSDTQIQFNSTGAFGASANLTFSANAFRVNGFIHAGAAAAAIRLSSAGDGVGVLTNDAGNDIVKVCWGGTTNLFPALYRSGTGLQLKLANDTGFAPFSAGDITASGNVSLASTSTLAWSTDVILQRDAADYLVQRRTGNNPQSFAVYNTYTSGSVYERGVACWKAVANVFQVGTEQVGATARGMALITNGVARLSVASTGELSSASSQFLMNPAWSGTGIATTPLLVNVSADPGPAAAASKLLDLQNSGTTVFGVRKDNIIQIGGSSGSPGLRKSGTTLQVYLADGSGFTDLSASALSSTGDITTTSGRFRLGASVDLELHRDAADTLAQRRSANGNTLRVYRTYTSSSTFERGVFGFHDSSSDTGTVGNTLRIGTEKGSVGGTARDIALITNGTVRVTYGATGGETRAEGHNITMGTTTGSKIGTATTEKIGFWNATPVVQQVLATGAGATVDNVITLLQTLGLCKQS